MTKKYKVSNFFKNKVTATPKKVTEPEETTIPADFETAITATGFGKYNLLLILVALPAGWSSIFETTTMSYVFPAAQCDLDLTLEDKGFLNAITYLGMISSALIWGFLIDALGRKKLILTGFAFDGLFVIISSFSQTKTLLIVSKFLGGFIINGPFAGLTSYLSEFHSARYRARMQLILGIIFNFGTVVLPLLAWTVLPQNIYFTISTLEFHSWNLYLFICSFPAITSAIAFLFMPESPKFLMTIGQNEKALKVFQNVYSFNTGNPIENYPIKELVDDTQQRKDKDQHADKVPVIRNKSQALQAGLQQLKSLFFPPHLKNIVLVCTMQTLFTVSLNTIRLWLPQIFQAINDYQYFNNGSSTDICQMLDMIEPAEVESDECTVNFNNSQVYINSITVAGASMLGTCFAGYLITILGKKKLMAACGIISGISGFVIYFSSNTAMIVTFAALFSSVTSAGTNVVLSVVVDLFPTGLRTTTVSLSMMMARSGAMVGNLTFPLLLRSGCAAPFFTVGSISFACTLLIFLLPNTDMKTLE